MDSLRSRLEALLQEDLMMNNNNMMISDSPLLSQDLELFNIDTPARLKNSTPGYFQLLQQRKDLASSQESQNFRNPSSFVPQNPLPCYERRYANSNFGCIFSDPTPLRFISESPLVTPLKFLNH